MLSTTFFVTKLIKDSLDFPLESKILLRESKDLINRDFRFSIHRFRKWDTKKSFFPKFIHRFNAFPTKFPEILYIECGKLIIVKLL